MSKWMKTIGFGSAALISYTVVTERLTDIDPNFQWSPWTLMGSDIHHIRRLNNNYELYLSSTSESDALYYMNRVTFIQRILLSTRRYPPAKFTKLCTVCQTTDLNKLGDYGPIHFTPKTLPPYLKTHLAVMGIDKLVETEVRHIFFVPNKKNYPGIFGDLPNQSRAMADPTSHSIFISDPKGTAHNVEYGPLIGHEAWHIRHNDDYEKYRYSEPATFRFEIEHLKILGQKLGNSLTDYENLQLIYRINGLIELLPTLATPPTQYASPGTAASSP